MPEIVDDTVSTGRSNLWDGAKYGLGRGVGLSVAGPVGLTVGGVAGATTVSSEAEQQTLATLAIADGITMLIGMGGQGANRGGVR